MPIYEYYCPSCRQRFEKMRPISQATAAATCERGHPAERAISTFAMGKGGVQMMEMPAGGDWRFGADLAGSERTANPDGRQLDRNPYAVPAEPAWLP